MRVERAILAIRQRMQAGLVLAVLVLTNSPGSRQEVEVEGEPGLPVWSQTVTDSQEPRPHFITVHQLVQVEDQQTAVLECAVANIHSALSSVTVSWLRWSDMSVLSVGGLVFSSDPRLRVMVSRLSPTAVSWSLTISPAMAGDSGDYQCQINTEPKLSLDVSLSVEGQWVRLAPRHQTKLTMFTSQETPPLRRGCHTRKGRRFSQFLMPTLGAASGQKK